MLPPGRARLLVLLLLTASLAGCNIRDWYNQEGWVHVELKVNNDPKTALDEFQRLQIAVFGVTIKQADALNPEHFAFDLPGPLLVNLVEKGEKDERVPLASFKTNLRATNSVAIRAVVVEAVAANGEPMEICRISDTPEKFPCFYQPEETAFVYTEKAFAPPRGGEVFVGFPVGVRFAQLGRVSEYFIEVDPSLVEITNKR